MIGVKEEFTQKMGQGQLCYEFLRMSSTFFIAKHTILSFFGF